MTTTTRFIYKIRNKKSGSFFQGYSSFGAWGKEFKSEATARTSLEYFVNNQIGRRLYSDKEQGPLTEEVMKTLFPYDLEIVKTEVIHKDAGVISLATHVKNVFLAKKISNTNYSFGRFWENATKKGYADQIEYVVQLDQVKGTPTSQTVKEARAQLRLLDIKTRTFREYQGMFGFYNRDQAFKARLTLNVKDSIDVAKLRKEIFG
ncbi:hypothetical protein D3C87_768570 [compost metagenome]